jgi:hypothetical protein
LPRTAYATVDPRAVILAEEVTEVAAWAGPGESGHINVVVDDRGKEVLDDLADEAEASGAFVLASANGIVLGEFDHRLLRSLSGVLAFSYPAESKTRFHAVLLVLGVSLDALPTISEEELAAACMLFADMGVGSPKRCAQSSWSELERERESLLEEKENGHSD